MLTSGNHGYSMTNGGGYMSDFRETTKRRERKGKEKMGKKEK